MQFLKWSITLPSTQALQTNAWKAWETIAVTSIQASYHFAPEVCDQGKEAVAQKIYAQEATESEG